MLGSSIVILRQQKVACVHMSPLSATWHINCYMVQLLTTSPLFIKTNLPRTAMYNATRSVMPHEYQHYFLAGDEHS